MFLVCIAHRAALFIAEHGEARKKLAHLTLSRKVVLAKGGGDKVKVGHGWDHDRRVEGWAAASEWTVVDARV